MDDSKHIVISREHYEKLREELEYKETTEKMKVAAQLEAARALGDLSENAEYDAAKNDQANLEARITELHQILENAEIMDEEDISTDAVGFGSRVTIEYDDDPDDREEYVIVGTSESDPANGRISNESPIGAALMGASVNDRVEAHLPGGKNIWIRVVEIAR